MNNYSLIGGKKKKTIWVLKLTILSHILLSFSQVKVHQAYSVFVI